MAEGKSGSNPVDGARSKDTTSEGNDDATKTGIKQVRFDQALTEEDRKQASAVRRKKVNQHTRSQYRFKAGDGKTNAVRDTLVLILVVVGMLYYAISSELQDSKKHKEESKDENVKHKEIIPGDLINKAVSSLQNMLMERGETMRRKESCSLFVAKSSVPCKSQGLFAGQLFKPGDVVIEAPSFIPLFNSTAESDSVTSYVASYAFLVKFHPTLANIDGIAMSEGPTSNSGDTEYTVRATKHIRPGDELFLPYEHHPAYLLSKLDTDFTFFQNIPTLDDYKLADEITRKVALTARQMETGHGRKINAGGQRTIETSHVYGLGKSLAEFFNPKVADLLPLNRFQYGDRGMDKHPSYWTGLKNQTLADLQISGSCISDISSMARNAQDDEPPVYTSLRRFEADEIVHVMPLLVMFRPSCSAAVADDDDDDDENDDFAKDKQCGQKELSSSWLLKDPCLSTSNSSIALCPLTGFSVQQESDTTSLDTTSTLPPANIELRWKTKNVDQITLKELREKPQASLLLKAVAITTIEVGDKLVVAKGAAVVEDLIPSQWRL
mmetsp:Transcript_21384/g.27644  ORF Transcript_21384/g.27644 Transcript_21384/m.27644 type:complete len:553 (+) Transcript_21384:218-1876(+)